MPRTGLQVIDPVHRAQVHRVDRKPVERVGRQSDYLARVERLRDAADVFRLRLVRMYAKKFSVQRARHPSS